jgi:hypothetical protein
MRFGTVSIDAYAAYGITVSRLYHVMKRSPPAVPDKAVYQSALLSSYPGTRDVHRKKSVRVDRPPPLPCIASALGGLSDVRFEQLGKHQRHHSLQP